MERLRFPSIHILCLLHCFLFSLVIATNTNITTDRDALLALKARISDDPDNLLVTNWSTSTSVCNWTGVTCGSRHHRVIGLNISYFCLIGNIPPQLGNLSFLSILNIRNNSFYGSIPLELAQLRRLKYINFGYNNFENENIPSWFGCLPKLEFLFLRGNGFIGTISSLSLNNISSLLQILDLSHNQLSGSFPSISVKLSSLLTISFSYNGLSGELPMDIFSYLPNLEIFSLSPNMFRGEIPIIALSEYCQNLQVLSLSMNNFTGLIPKEIGNLIKLKELYLGINQLQGEIPQEIGNLAELEVLSLPENVLTGKIPLELGNLEELEIVSLYDNALTGTIPKEMGNLTRLNAIDFSNNKLQGEIPPEIGNLLNLEYLNLEWNNLVGVVPPSIFNSSTIRILSLSTNKFNGSLPSSIGLGLPNLEMLYLNNNNFSGIIPTSITNISKLSVLAMQKNSFSGFIPNTFGNLRSLTRLSFYSIHLRSSTPDLSFLSSMTNCKHLKVLYVSENPLNGILPSSIGNLSFSLERFYMSDCNISGIIPEEIGSLSNLILLSIENNELSGSIPITLGRLPNLQVLTLPNNKLHGFIPADLCGLKELYKLYLDTNKLSGPIPACLGNLQALRYLSLGSNRLTSVIPLPFWNLKDILSVDLSSNYLNGPLPLDIGNLKVATFIDLSRNILSSEIPTTIRSLQNLQYLDLRFNRLNGPIPNIFGDMKSMEYLDLSNNNLSGIIPESLETVPYLKYLNMSFNRLEGQVPTEGCFTNLTTESFMGNHALCGSPQFQVPPCKISTHRKTRTTTLLIILLPTMSVALIVILTFIFTKKCRKLPTDVELSTQATWRRISYLELMRATNGFDESNLLGMGGFGSVYKGLLEDGMEIAVKVFHMQLEGAPRSFDVECEVMSSIRHRNLVKIISSCTNDDFKALVLEYMPNGSLDMHLYSHNHFLDILQRLDIMIDVASALEYLHFGNSTPIVHCDLKPSNVLLDENMVANLSDFGIAKLFCEEESMTQTQTLATIGYMAPEYGREGKVSRKGDVYSYGIMLMETFTRKKPTDEIFVGEMSLRCWVGDSLRDGSIIEVVDANLLRREDTHHSAKAQCASSVLRLAMDCTTDLAVQRIDMKSVVSRLIKVRVTLIANTRRR